MLLIGGTSEIGVAILRRLLEDGPLVPVLAGRDEPAMRTALEQLRGLGATDGAVVSLDLADDAARGAGLEAAFSAAGVFDLVLLAAGVLGGQAGLDADDDELLRVMRVNFEGAGAALIECLRRLRAAGTGTLAVLSSVAVERPRAANAVYGAAKAGLDALAQGLADAAHGDGVRVLIVRPGFVFTKMTAGLEPAPMATTPDAVAEATVAALAGRAHTVWVPGRLRWVFFVLRHLPRAIYRRLPL